MGRSKTLTLPPGKFRKLFGAGVVVVPEKSVASGSQKPIVITDSDGTTSDSDASDSGEDVHVEGSDRVPNSNGRGSSNDSNEAQPAQATQPNEGSAEKTGSGDNSGDTSGRGSAELAGKRKRWNCDYDRKRWACSGSSGRTEFVRVVA